MVDLVAFFWFCARIKAALCALGHSYQQHVVVEFTKWGPPATGLVITFPGHASWPDAVFPFIEAPDASAALEQAKALLHAFAWGRTREALAGDAFLKARGEAALTELRAVQAHTPDPSIVPAGALAEALKRVALPVTAHEREVLWAIYHDAMAYPGEGPEALTNQAHHVVMAAYTGLMHRGFLRRRPTRYQLTDAGHRYAARALREGPPPEQTATAPGTGPDAPAALAAF